MAPKATKPQTFEIDGATVVLTRIPVRRHQWGYTEVDGEQLGHPREQALIEIQINDVVIGLASRQHGWGKQPFAIDRLHETNDRVIGPKTAYGDVKSRDEQDLFEMEAIAVKALELYRSGNLRPLAELEKAVAEFKVKESARKAREQSQLEQWKREREEAAAKAETERTETLEGLRSIRERFAGQLSNFESVALDKAINAYAVKRN